MRNNSGKTLTIFLVVIAVLLVSLTIISVFFFLEEVELRKTAEYNLEQMSIVEAKLQADLKEAKKQSFLYEEKVKEGEDKIESLMEDLELEQGLREEIKKENRQLRESLEKETQAKDEIRTKMEKDLQTADERANALQAELDNLKSQAQDMQQKRDEAEQKLNELKTQADGGAAAPQAQAMGDDVNLAKIVVTPPGDNKGKVISVDRETEFVIVSLGQKDGIKKEDVLSVYRGDQYLGDIKVSRVLPEMSAADFVPPLNSQQVRKDDRAVPKKK